MLSQNLTTPPPGHDPAYSLVLIVNIAKILKFLVHCPHVLFLAAGHNNLRAAATNKSHAVLGEVVEAGDRPS